MRKYIAEQALVKYEESKHIKENENDPHTLGFYCMRVTPKNKKPRKNLKHTFGWK